MDARRLRAGELLAGVGALALVGAMSTAWFDGRTAWTALPAGRVALALSAALALTLVLVTLRTQAVALATATASLTIAFGGLTLAYALYRVGLDGPGPDADVAVGAGAYAGLAFLLAIVAGAWRALADERTGAPASRRQTERVLAVRGAPRPVPPPRAERD